MTQEISVKLTVAGNRRGAFLSCAQLEVLAVRAACDLERRLANDQGASGKGEHLHRVHDLLRWVKVGCAMCLCCSLLQRWSSSSAR